MYSQMQYIPESATYHVSLYVAIRSISVITGVVLRALDCTICVLQPKYQCPESIK